MDSETLGEDLQSVHVANDHIFVPKVNSNAFISPGRQDNQNEPDPYQNISGEALIDSLDHRDKNVGNDATRVIGFDKPFQSTGSELTNGTSNQLD